MKLKSRYRLLLLTALISVPFMLLLTGVLVGQLYELFFKEQNENVPFHESAGYPVMMVVFLIGLITMAFLFSISINALLNKIALLQTTIKKLASNTDIPETLPVGRLDELGELTQAVNLLVERTTYRELELKQQRKMETEMMQKLKHDINTPLTALRLQLFYLEDEFKNKDAISSMYQQIEYIAELSSDIPFHSTKGLADSYVINENVEMNAFCQMMVSKWSYLYSIQNISIQISKSKEPIIWDTSELWLQRLFDNVLQNTLRHSGAANLNIIISREVLSISDDGLGFEVKNEHTGLGLKIIKDIAEVLQLNYRLESSNQGTSYKFLNHK